MKEPRRKADKEALSKLLKEIDITSDEMSEKEVQKLQDLNHILSESPELRNLPMEEIIGMLNISEEDKLDLTNQVNKIIDNEKAPISEEELRKEFPGLEKESMEMMKALDAECSKNPAFRTNFLAWTQRVQQALGTDMEKVETLDEMELARVTTPPPEVREVLDRIMPDISNLGAMTQMNSDDIWKDDDDKEPVEIEEIKIKYIVCKKHVTQSVFVSLPASRLHSASSDGRSYHLSDGTKSASSFSWEPRHVPVCPRLFLEAEEPVGSLPDAIVKQTMRWYRDRILDGVV